MNMNSFENLCRIKDQMKLKGMLEKELRKFYPEVINKDGFVYAPSKNVDIMLTAHMDTVHDKSCKHIYKVVREGKDALWSPEGIGGDDRCGIWIILQILRTTEYRPAILFCEDEEIGGVGSKKFAKWIRQTEEGVNLKYLVQIDRRNGNDAVFYDCGNVEFQHYIENKTGFVEAHGTFTDICNISPELDVASVNLSCGYYLEHTLNHYVIPAEMDRTREAVLLLLEDVKNVEKFDYADIWMSKYGKYCGYGFNTGYSGYSSLYEDDDPIVVVAVKNGMEIIQQFDNYYDQDECILSFLIDNPDVCYNEITYIGSVYEYQSLYGDEYDANITSYTYTKGV